MTTSCSGVTTRSEEQQTVKLQLKDQVLFDILTYFSKKGLSFIQLPA